MISMDKTVDTFIWDQPSCHLTGLDLLKTNGRDGLDLMAKISSTEDT